MNPTFQMGLVLLITLVSVKNIAQMVLGDKREFYQELSIVFFCANIIAVGMMMPGLTAMADKQIGIINFVIGIVAYLLFGFLVYGRVAYRYFLRRFGGTKKDIELDASYVLYISFFWPEDIVSHSLRLTFIFVKNSFFKMINLIHR